jgi:hypothetical protein
VSDADPILPGRGCGSCTLCCKLLAIDEIDKPRGAWCRHCDIGRGCRIYAERPGPCREFHCGYLTWDQVGEHWLPAKAKMVMMLEPSGDRLAVYVDPSRPDAWREQPYYGELKHWSRLAARELKQVIVVVGDRSIAILPDEDVDLGVTTADERIVLGEVVENGRVKLRAMKLKADDPRLAGVETGALYGPASNPFGRGDAKVTKFASDAVRATGRGRGCVGFARRGR